MASETEKPAKETEGNPSQNEAREKSVRFLSASDRDRSPPSAVSPVREDAQDHPSADTASRQSAFEYLGASPMTPGSADGDKEKE